MTKEERIYIPEQFDMASDHGYLRAHIELTRKLQAMFEPEIAPANATFVEGLQQEDIRELFHQACEDIARHILLHEEAITSLPVAEVQGMVEDRYNQYLGNPELATSTRGSAIH